MQVGRADLISLALGYQVPRRQTAGSVSAGASLVRMTGRLGGVARRLRQCRWQGDPRHNGPSSGCLVDGTTRIVSAPRRSRATPDNQARFAFNRIIMTPLVASLARQARALPWRLPGRPSICLNSQSHECHDLRIFVLCLKNYSDRVWTGLASEAACGLTCHFLDAGGSCALCMAHGPRFISYCR